MKRKLIIFLMGIVLLISFSFGSLQVNSASKKTEEVKKEGTLSFDVITKAFDWGPGNAEIVINTGNKLSNVSQNTFKVKGTKKYTTPLDEKNNTVTKKTETKEIKVLNTYISDKRGVKTTKASPYITLELEVHPDNIFTSPYDKNEKIMEKKRVGIDYHIDQVKDIQTKKGDKLTNIELKPSNLRKNLTPSTEKYDYGKFQYKDKKYGNIDLTYASFKSNKTKQKQPLIVALHGLGEKGTDAEIPLLGNKLTALSSDKIQSYFGGAQILVPQTETMWMDDGSGKDTTDGNNMYTKSLLALIKSYVKKNSETIDMDRIYVGGVSNGGYMTLKLLLADPDYFAAGFPVSEAYESKWLSDKELNKIKNIPMWFVQSKDDPDVSFKTTTDPTVKRLHKLGAEDTKLTVYDHVRDISGGVKDKKGNPYQYNGHWSWVYVYNDAVADEQGTSLYEWLAQQHK